MANIDLTPRPGTLTAHFFAAGEISDGPRLCFAIDLPLQPFAFGGEPIETSIRLDFIDLKLRDWRDLGDMDISFPVNPEPHSVDGSVYLGGVHNPVDLTRAEFGPLDEGWIAARLSLAILFSFEGTALDDVATTFAVRLAYSAADFDKAFAAAHQSGYFAGP